ncbi:MAG: D-alanyl-D-alanine carboxypeptidase/D-alanyl-D-alanine-endopeptidase [Balneolaceae bacterium]
MKKSLSAVALIMVLFFSVEWLNAQPVDPIRDIIDNSRVSNSFWALQVRNQNGEILYDYNGDHLIRPASNLKLVSSAAFLELLGADYRFNTTLYGRGEVENDRWKGDLIVRGVGDPSINGEMYDDPLFLFEKWYQVLDSMGVKTIDGNLIGHDGFFDDVPYPRGWEWDDLSYYYAPEISPLSFNFNVVDLEVLAEGEVGSKPRIEWFPFNTPYIHFVNEQTIAPANTKYDESYRRELGTNTIYLRSRLPQGHYETEPLSVNNPSLYFMDTFKRYLEKRGIQVLGQLLIDKDRYDWRGFEEIDTHQSEPLHKMIKWMNRESDNFYAEMLLKTLAAENVGVQGSTELGLRVFKEYMNDMGMDTTSVQLRDASGMAPATQMKASDLNKFLIDVQSKPYFDDFYNSLSVGGMNGTLQYRFGNSNMFNKFVGKSGFMSGVRSLSGYLETQSGEQVTVTIVTNNYSLPTFLVDRVHEQILEYVYSAY